MGNAKITQLFSMFEFSWRNEKVSLMVGIALAVEN